MRIQDQNGKLDTGVAELGKIKQMSTIAGGLFLGNGMVFKSKEPGRPLVLWYDFSNTSCYSGSGSTLVDLSGYGNDGTLVNSPKYDGDDHGGSITTSRNDNQFIKTDNTFNLGTSWTISVIANISASQTYWATLWGNDSYPGVGYWALQTASNNLQVNNSGFGGITYSGTIQDSIKVFDITYDGSTAIVYINGSSVVSGSLPAPILANNGLYFGSRHQNGGDEPPTDLMNATFYQMKVYSLALDSSTVLSNFNGVKSQYDL